MIKIFDAVKIYLEFIKSVEFMLFYEDTSEHVLMIKIGKIFFISIKFVIFALI